MKEVQYNDPYEVPVVIQIEENDAEGIEEVIRFLNDDARQTQNIERKERYHTSYHLEGLEYEGMDYASETDVASDVANRDEEHFIDEWLRKSLTPVQYRRFRLFMEGNSIREVARLERADYSSVNESIKAARKKLQKIWKDTPSKIPPHSPY